MYDFMKSLLIRDTNKTIESVEPKICLTFFFSPPQDTLQIFKQNRVALSTVVETSLMHLVALRRVFP